MVKPEKGFSEAVRARVKELTGEDPGHFIVGDIFPGPNYFEASFEDRVEQIAQSLVRIRDGDCEVLYPESKSLDGGLATKRLDSGK